MSDPGSAMVRTASMIDRFSIKCGHVVSWLTLLMVIATFTIVVLRYLFDMGFIWLQESLTWMHACVFMLGAAYTLQCEEHVRVDIFYRDMNAAKRAWVNIFGVLLFLLPLSAYLAMSGIDYAAASWRVGEQSVNSGGLPYPAVPVLKSIVVVMPCAVALQGAALLLRSIDTLRAD